jgi:hypothetical protein
LLGVCHSSCLLQPACEGFPLPTSSALREHHPLCYVPFLLLLLIIQFLFFPWWGLVCPGVSPSVVCVSTRYHLNSPCGLHLPKPSGHWHLVVAWEPSWFLCLMWSGDAMCNL